MNSIVPILVATVAFNVTAQLLLKVGATRPGVATFFPLSIINPITGGALLCLIIAVGLYTLVLQRLPLIVAQSILTIQFAATVIAASVILGERLSPAHFCGVALIAVGLFLLAS